MKQIIFILALACLQLHASAQEKLTPEKAKLIMSSTVANITEAVAFAYVKGNTYEEFRKILCGSATPTQHGNAILEISYAYLSKGFTKNAIIKDNNGKTVAAALQVLSDYQQKGIDPAKVALFGNEQTLQQNDRGTPGKCRWYQLWCHVQSLVIFLIENTLPSFDMPLFLNTYYAAP